MTLASGRLVCACGGPALKEGTLQPALGLSHLVQGSVASAAGCCGDKVRRWEVLCAAWPAVSV